MATQDNKMATFHSDPLNVLPAVVWEVLLEKMEDDDMIKVSRSIPALEEYVDKGRLFKWHVAQILPLLIPKYIDTSEAVLCRQVSKHWRDVVDHTLETHPDWLPYKSERLDKMHEDHINYTRLPTRDFEDHRPTTWLSVWDDAIQRSDNPFPGRRVSLRVPRLQEMNDWIVPQIRILGHHIRYFHGYIYERVVRTDAIFIERRLKPLLQCLRFLPNLKSLRVSGDLPFANHGQAHAAASREPGICLGMMPFQLETLDLQEFYWFHSPTGIDTVIQTVVNHDGIQKLAVNLECWESRHGPLFPKLIELYVDLYKDPQGPGMESMEDDSPKVVNLLLDVNSCKLKKLTLLDAGFSRNLPNILTGLAPFNLESIHLILEVEAENWKSGLILESVQDLCVAYVRPNDSLRYLASFPSLKTLRLQIWGSQWEDEEFDGHEVVETPFQEAFRNFYFFHRVDWNNWTCFWESFPHLKVLTVFTEPSGKPSFTHQYARECPGNVFTPLGQPNFNEETLGYLM